MTGPADTSTQSLRLTMIDLQGCDTDDRACLAGAADQIRRAAESFGLFGIVGHGVPATTISSLEDVSRAFFALPAAEKARCTPASIFDYVGYYGMESLTAAATEGERTPRDLFEAFSCGPYDDIRDSRDEDDPLFGRNIWPDTPPELRRIWLQYFAEMERLSRTLLRLFALALELEEDWFQVAVGAHLSELIANHYPPQPTPPLPGQIRQGAHTDFGTLTILRASDGIPGLQVRPRDSASWLDVPPVRDGFLVNISDLMTRWTNGRWVSPLHRVNNPPAEYAHRDRLTIPFFHNPAQDVVVAPVPTTIDDEHPARYEPVLAGDWIRKKMGRTPRRTTDAPRR